MHMTMKTTMSRHKLIEIVKKNFEEHKTIMKEANEGYIAAAKKLLTEKMAKLDAGEPVAMSFHLARPNDQSKTYEIALQMLEYNEISQIELEAEDFRNLVLDQWGWMDGFLEVSSQYSNTAVGKRGIK